MKALPLEGDTLSFVIAPWFSGRFLVLDLDVIPPKTCFSFLIFLPVNLRLALLCWTLLVLSSLDDHIIVKMIGLVNEWKKLSRLISRFIFSYISGKVNHFFQFFCILIIESSEPYKSREKTCQYTLRDVMFALGESIKATDWLRRHCMVNICFASMVTIYDEQIKILWSRLMMYRLLIK